MPRRRIPILPVLLIGLLPMLLGASLGVTLMAWRISKKPVTYHSTGKLMLTRGTIAFSQDPPSRDFAAGVKMQMNQAAEIINTQQLATRAEVRIEAMHPDVQPTNVHLIGRPVESAGLLIVSAVGERPTYTQLYLDAVMDEFLAAQHRALEEAGQPESAGPWTIVERALPVYQRKPPFLTPIIIGAILGALIAAVIYAAAVALAFALTRPKPAAT